VLNCNVDLADLTIFGQKSAYRVSQSSTRKTLSDNAAKLAPVVHFDFVNFLYTGASMPLQRSVLVVDVDPQDLGSLVSLLRAEGYRVAAAAGFEEAKHHLASEPPDLLITSLRLGPYNGLHLVLRSRVDHPGMAALVTTRFPDPVLEAEAHRQRASFVVTPLSDRDFLDAVTRAFSELVTPALGQPTNPSERIDDQSQLKG